MSNNLWISETTRLNRRSKHSMSRGLQPVVYDISGGAPPPPSVRTTTGYPLLTCHGSTYLGIPDELRATRKP